MKCSLPNRGPAEENKRGLPFSHSVETLKGFISSPPKLMGPPSCAEHHARHWVKLMPHCPLGLGVATVLPGCPGLLGSSGPSRKAVLPENSELISLVLWGLWCSPVWYFRSSLLILWKSWDKYGILMTSPSVISSQQVADSSPCTLCSQEPPLESFVSFTQTLKSFFFVPHSHSFPWVIQYSFLDAVWPRKWEVNCHSFNKYLLSTHWVSHTIWRHGHGNEQKRHWGSLPSGHFQSSRGAKQ